MEITESGIVIDSKLWQRANASPLMNVIDVDIAIYDSDTQFSNAESPIKDTSQQTTSDLIWSYISLAKEIFLLSDQES